MADAPVARDVTSVRSKAPAHRQQREQGVAVPLGWNIRRGVLAVQFRDIRRRQTKPLFAWSGRVGSPDGFTGICWFGGIGVAARDGPADRDRLRAERVRGREPTASGSLCL